MNKARLIELVTDPSKVHEKDLPQLKELSAQHPYSQILHILIAKAHYNLEHPDTSQIVQKAATYCWDRVRLKHTLEDTLSTMQVNVVEAPPEVPEAPPWEEEVDYQEPVNFDWINEDETSAESATEEVTEGTIPSSVSPIGEAISPDESTSDAFILEEPVQEEPVSSSKANDNEIIDAEYQATSAPDDLNENISEEPAELSEEIIAHPDEEVGASLAEEDNVQKPAPDVIDQPAADESAQDVKDAGDEDLLDLEIAAEIQSSSIHEELMQNLSKLQESRKPYKDEPDIAPELSEAVHDIKDQQDQVEIIDAFIKNSPVLSKPNLSADSEATSQKDLSKKSATFSDDLVSEQLAKIMVKQGSKKEAVKIYKKLIRKFPKKKSYFAGQIENLSKK